MSIEVECTGNGGRKEERGVWVTKFGLRIPTGTRSRQNELGSSGSHSTVMGFV